MVNLRSRPQAMSNSIASLRKATTKRGTAKKALTGTSQQWVGCNFVRSDGSKCPVKQLVFIPPGDFLSLNLDQFMCGFCMPEIIRRESKGIFSGIKFQPPNDTTKQTPSIPAPIVQGQIDNNKNHWPPLLQSNRISKSIPKDTVPKNPPLKQSQVSNIASHATLRPTASSFMPNRNLRESAKPPTVIDDDRDHQARRQNVHIPDNAPICEDHRRGTCLNINTSCRFQHPAKCWFMLKSGRCSKNDCVYYHGLLFCHSSLSTGRCYKINCNYHHIKKTARFPPQKNRNNNPGTPLQPASDPFLGLVQQISDRLSDLERNRVVNSQSHFIPIQDPSIIKLGYAPQGQNAGQVFTPQPPQGYQQPQYYPQPSQMFSLNQFPPSQNPAPNAVITGAPSQGGIATRQ